MTAKKRSQNNLQESLLAESQISRRRIVRNSPVAFAAETDLEERCRV